MCSIFKNPTTEEGWKQLIEDYACMMGLGKYMYSDAVQNTVIKGYDHIFSGKDNLYLSLSDPKSGRKMEITSDYKDVVIYTNNAGSNTGFFSTIMDKKYLGIAIEPCRYSNILKENGLIQKSNEVYDHYIEYKFSLMESPDD